MKCKYRSVRQHLQKKSQIYCQIRAKNYPIERKCTSRCEDWSKKLSTHEKLVQKSMLLELYMKENPSLKVQTRGMVRPCKWCERMLSKGFNHCLHCGSLLK